MISLKIDVTKIEKQRLFKGEKGTYLNCVLIETPNSEYSDYMIVQDVSKEERERGVKGTILGNAKIVSKAQNSANNDVKHESNTNVQPTQETDNLPF